MKANEQLTAALNKCTEGLRASLMYQFTVNADATLKEFQEQAAKTGSLNTYDHYKEVSSYGSSRSEYFRVQAYRAAVARAGFLKRVEMTDAEYAAAKVYSREKTIVLEGAALTAEFAKRAAEYATAALAGFIFKMQSKLNAMGTLTKVVFDGSLGNNRIDLTYTNATMNITNTVIIKSSNRGLLFNQFPTTFHTVVINGTPLKTPSEAKVKKAMKEAATGEKIADVTTYIVRATSKFYPQATRPIFKGEDKAQAEAALAAAKEDKRRYSYAYMEAKVT